MYTYKFLEGSGGITRTDKKEDQLKRYKLCDSHGALSSKSGDSDCTMMYIQIHCSI